MERRNIMDIWKIKYSVFNDKTQKQMLKNATRFEAGETSMFAIMAILEFEQSINSDHSIIIHGMEKNPSEDQFKEFIEP